MTDIGNEIISENINEYIKIRISDSKFVKNKGLFLIDFGKLEFNNCNYFLLL